MDPEEIGPDGKKSRQEKYKFSEQRNKKKQELDTEIWREKTTRELDELYENFLTSINSPKFNNALINKDEDGGDVDNDSDISDISISSNEPEKEEEDDEKQEESPILDEPVMENFDDIDTTFDPNEVIRGYQNTEKEESTETEESSQDSNNKESESSDNVFEEQNSYFQEVEGEEDEEEEEEESINERFQGVKKSYDKYFSKSIRKPELKFRDHQLFSSELWDEAKEIHFQLENFSSSSDPLKKRLDDLKSIKDSIEKKFMKMKVIQHIHETETRNYKEKLKDITDYGKKINFRSKFLQELKVILDS